MEINTSVSGNLRAQEEERQNKANPLISSPKLLILARRFGSKIRACTRDSSDKRDRLERRKTYKAETT